ncbi:transmembrane protein 164 isoform X3 [Drosophila biarmipes]|nr:transmembrane protein 164 isoform X3 [Drosophila biarmipes]
MSNLNGPFLAFLFPEIEGRTYPFEQATYWIQHALLYIIPIYIIRSGAYTVEDLSEFHWSHIGTAFMLFYHFVLLSPLSIFTGINLDHMLCAAMSDPFQGPNYRLFACCHQTLLCPLLSKGTVLLFCRRCSTSLKRSGDLPEVRSEADQYTLTPADYATQVDVTMRHRFSNQEAADEGHPHKAGDLSSLAEYAMPTTKID